MNEKLFIDTWGWVVLYNKREPKHAEIDSFYRRWRLRSGTIYTSGVAQNYRCISVAISNKTRADK